MVATTLGANFPVSERVAEMKASATLAAMQAAEAMRAAGVDVVDLGPGEPDFDTPQNIKDAAAEAMRAGKTKYTPTAGTRELQKAIIEMYARDFGANYERNEVMATSGGKQAIFNAVVTLINPGDDVLIPKPYWVTFPEIVTFAGGRSVFIETEENGFVLTADMVRRTITPKTKLIILNSPSNPSGRVIPPNEFRSIMEVLAERGIYAVSDECYLRFVYPPATVFSAASLPSELRKRLCIAGSFSKTYAMTGWRIGYGVMPEWLVDAVNTLMANSNSCTASFTQRAAIAALSGPRTEMDKMIQEFRKRRDCFCEALNQVPGFECALPGGAFYAFANVQATRIPSKQLADFLLSEAGVACLNGGAFGEYGEGYTRFSYANSIENLMEAARRIQAASSRWSH